MPVSPAPSAITPGSIDTQVQVFARRGTAAPQARVVPEDEAPVERYLDLLDAHGLAGAVLVQPGFRGTDNAYLLATLARLKTRFRGVVAIEPETDAAELARLRAAGVAGIRLDIPLILPERAAEALAAPRWRDFLVRIGRAGLHVEVNAEGAAWHDIVKPLTAAGTRLVIEYFGRPGSGLGPRCPGFQTLVAASRTADIWFKLAGPYRFQPPTAAWACADVLLTIAGPGRLVWGSDWPWLQHARDVPRYADTIHWLTEWVPNEAARAQILGANARTLYGFNKPAATAAAVWRKL